jgi:hypothetical protein
VPHRPTRTSWIPALAVASLASLAALASTACGASPSPQIDESDTVVAATTNPYGKPYPSKDLGTSPRRQKFAGSTMPNLAFRGYRDGARSSGLETISLADYFDPETRKFKLVHISVSAVWCTECDAESTAIANLSAGLKSKGVVFLEVLAEGPALSSGATMTDLDQWMERHKTPVAQALDPNLKKLGIFFDGSAFPFSINLDARSMEVLTAVNEGSVDVEKEVLEWVTWIDSHPAVAR